MGDKKAKPITTAHIVTGSGAKTKRPKRRLPKWLVITLVIFLVVIAAGGYLLKRHSDNVKAERQQVQARLQKYPNVKSPQDAAYAYAANKDYNSAQQVIDDQLKSASSSEDKAAAYMTQATIAYNAQKYNEAKGYAQKAEASTKTSATANLLGDIAIKQNNKVEAAKQYQVAIDRLDKNARSYPNQIKVLQAKVETLK